MISLCDGFEPRVQQPNYKEWLFQRYKNYNFEGRPIQFVNAHPTDNLRGRGHIDSIYERVTKEYALNPEQTLIVHGHLSNFFSAIDNGILDELGTDYLGIVMDYPPEKSMPWNRIQAYGYHSPFQNYELPLMISKTQNPNENVLHIDDTNGFHLDTVKFFTPEGSQHLRELLKEKFEVELPPEADELHSIWFTWMKHVVDEKNIEYWNNNLNNKKYSDYLKTKKDFKPINIK
jgi:hypothetical protein